MKTTPLKSIRKFCLWCCNGKSQEVKLCPAKCCPLHSRRLGKGGGRILKIIRAKCIDCTGGVKMEIRDCQVKENIDDLCPLHPYRLGKRPKSRTALSARVLKQRIEGGKRLQRTKAKKGVK